MRHASLAVTLHSFARLEISLLKRRGGWATVADAGAGGRVRRGRTTRRVAPDSKKNSVSVKKNEQMRLSQ